MTMALHFTVPGEPRGKGRPRFSSRGGFVRSYTDAKTRTYEELVTRQASLAYADCDPLPSPMSVRIICHAGIPVSWSKRKQQAALQGTVIPGKPDLDNVAKAVLDAMNKVIYLDDAQVIRLVIEKKYSLEPRLEVYVNEILP